MAKPFASHGLRFLFRFANVFVSAFPVLPYSVVGCPVGGIPHGARSALGPRGWSGWLAASPTALRSPGGFHVCKGGPARNEIVMAFSINTAQQMLYGLLSASTPTIIQMLLYAVLPSTPRLRAPHGRKPLLSARPRWMAAALQCQRCKGTASPPLQAPTWGGGATHHTILEPW